MIDNAIERNIKVRPPKPGIEYFAFVDMSGGSNDDATLAIAHLEGDGDDSRAVLDIVMDQGQRAPFDPRQAVERFAKILKPYRCFSVVGDAYAGQTFVNDFEGESISYDVSQLTKSQIYEALEPRLNAGRVSLLDDAKLESQLLGLIWRSNKIDHPGGEHDDFANAAAGAIHIAFEGGAGATFDDLFVGGRELPAYDDGIHSPSTSPNICEWDDQYQSNLEAYNERNRGDDDDSGWF